MKFAFASGARPLEGYTLKRGIGRGGFGEVYFAVSDAGKEVALKKIERNMEVELRGVGQCLNLRHANLVELYDVKYDEQNEPWVVMEYIAGSSLKDILDANSRGLPEDEILPWFKGIAAGVAYLHDHGIVHRDLKPANIFDDSGTVKIGDYGLSKYISCSRRSGQTESVGTCHYMAPEIGKGEYGKEIDIYALGIVLFELLTGRVPFDGESSQEVLMKHLTSDPDLTALPDPIRRVLAKALRKDPEHRYSTVDAMTAEVEAALAPVKDEAVMLQPSAILTIDDAAPAGAVAEAASVLPVRVESKSPARETLYIGEPAEDIEFGPVKAGPGRPITTSGRAQVSPPRRNGPGQIPPLVATPAAVRLPPAPVRAAPRPEPVAAAVRDSSKKLWDWLQHGPGGTVFKACIALGVLGGAAILLITVPQAATVCAIGGALYLVYVGLRTLVQVARQTPVVTIPRPTGRRGLTQLEAARIALRMKTPWDRIGELSGSLLAASLVSGILCIILAAWTGRLAADPYSLTFLAWLGLSGTLCAWTILTAGKVWELDEGEPWKRRFVLLILGLACGCASFALNQALLVRLDDQWLIGSLLGNTLSQSLHAADGSPRLGAYLLYFAAFFGIVGWWKQTDPLRESRLNIGGVVMTALAALILPFPQPWGLTIAVTASIAAQLTATWLSPRERVEMHEKLRQRVGDSPA